LEKGVCDAGHLFFMSLVALRLGCQKQSTPVAVAPVTTAEAEPEIDVTPIVFEATAAQLLVPKRPTSLFVFPNGSPN
jgi:hypothetical protein